MRIRDRLIGGVFNAITDLLFLILMLILYSLLSSYLSHIAPNIPSLISEYLVLIVAFAILAFLKGVLSGHVLVYPVILGEAVLITAIFLSIPTVIAIHGIVVNVSPLIYFLWAIDMSWIVYSLISQFNNTLMDP
ncbi:MAG: hypothetical protein ACP5GZ_09385 [Vulcanisaeta sp.]|uniref:hypothetical protein n=1 Tax=Vulcanisaeta sp. TaxID=2020871 RepID=UPI003D0DBF64